VGIVTLVLEVEFPMVAKLSVFCRFGLATFVLGSLVSAAPLGGIRGQITDSEGAVIAGAHLLIHPDGSGRIPAAKSTDVQLETDRMGRFGVQLEPGFYDVCVMANAFTPQCRKVLVTNDGVVEYRAHLTVDPLVVNSLGDRF
jgi:hypothetical protein